jgi:hypothetical protein
MVLEEYVLVVMVVLLALALVGAYLAYPPHVEPGTEVETVEDARWSSTGQYSHEATVQQETEVFEAGTVLRNRGSYFQRVTPILNGSFFYRYEATDGGDLQANTTLLLVLRSVGDEGEQVYWRLAEPVGSTSATSLSPGDTVRASFSTNVSAMTDRLSAVDEQLGGTPGTKELVLQSQVNLSGTRNGEVVDRQRVYEMRVDSQGNVYSVENAGPQTDSGVLTSDEVVTATYGPARSIGGPLLAAVALLGCLGLAVGRYRDAFAVSEDERTWLAYTGQLREFDEWITSGSLPEEMLSAPRAPVDSLDGIVDVAIDSNRRVLEDRERGLCAVFVDDVLYTYEVPAAVRATERSEPLAAAPPTGGDHGPALDHLTAGNGDADDGQRTGGQNAGETAETDGHSEEAEPDSEPGATPADEQPADDADEDAAGPA